MPPSSDPERPAQSSWPCILTILSHKDQRGSEMPTNTRPLKRLTADDLRPLWSRLDIPTRRMADALGVSRAALSAKAHSLGLPSRKDNKENLKKCPDEVFRRMYQGGVSLRGIADHCGYAKIQCVTQRRTMMGLPPRGKLDCGSMSLAEFHEREFARMMVEAAAKAGKVGGP